MESKPLWNVFRLSILLFNLSIVFKTYQILNNARESKIYSHLDNDRPLNIFDASKLSPVELTFSESAWFDQSNDKSTALAWNTLWTNQYGLGYQHLGRYQFRAITGMYHALHCLHKMELAFEHPDHIHSPSSHFIHCIALLHEMFLCNADHSLEDGDFLKRNFTLDRVGETHTCKDWSQVAHWVDEEFDRWIEANGIHKSDLWEAPAGSDWY